MGMIIVLLIVLGIAHRITTAEQRAQLLQTVVVSLGQLKEAAKRRPECEPFLDALVARTPKALLTPTLVALNVAIFVFMLFGSGALGDTKTLVGWGANFAPRTTNGEWWRVVTSMFVHGGLFQLLFNVAALFQIGLILERLVGRFTVAVVYVGAGIFATLLSLSSYPLAVSMGASGAVFGLYGLLIASCVWGEFYPSSMTIPLITLKRLVPTAALFILYNLASESLPFTAELGGLFVGLVSGLVLARGVGESTPADRQVGTVMGVLAAIAVAFAIPLRGIADVRPEIERLISVEDRTATDYKAAVDRFKTGRINADALVQMIDSTIMPELEAADARLKALGRVPAEHQPLVASAEEYLRLRDESWRLRAEGLRNINMPVPRTLGKGDRTANQSLRLRAEARYRTDLRTRAKAEETERASLVAFKKMRSADQK